MATPDADLVALGHRASWSGSAWSDAGVVEAGYVVRMPKAYPVYDERYQRNVDVHPGLAGARACRTCTRSGRNGMHRYNNQDHSMLTAMLTAENIATAARTTSGRSTSSRTTTRSAPAGGDGRRGTGPRRPGRPGPPAVRRPPDQGHGRGTPRRVGGGFGDWSNQLTG